MNLIGFFLIFLAIPIIVHLFNFRKIKEIHFSNVKFINKISIELKAKSKLKHYLLLTSRFFLFFSLIGFLYIFLNPDSGRVDSKSLIYLDNSISHSIKTNGFSSLERMKEVVGELVEINETSVMMNDLSGLTISSVDNSSLDNLNSIDHSFDQLPISQVVDLMSNSIDYNTLYFFSDLQGASLDDFGSIKSDTSKSYYFVYDDLTDKRNAFVDSVFLVKNIDDFGSLVLNIRIGTSENFSSGNLIVKLLSEDKQVSSVVKVIEDVGTIQFDIPGFKDADYEISLSGDDVEYDNKFFLSISKSQNPKISLISDDQNGYLEKVFEKKKLFDLTKMNSNSIDFSTLETSDMIVLNGMISIPNSMIDQIRGSTVIIFPTVNNTKTNTGTGKYMGFNYDDYDDRNLYRSTLDTKHSLFEGVFEKSKLNSIQPEGSIFYDFRGVFDPIIKLSNGKTFLAKASNTSFYMLSSPLDLKYTNLPVHGIFLPLMYQLAISSVPNSHMKASYYPGEIITIKGNLSDVPIRLLGSVYETVPEFNYVKGNVNVEIPSSLVPGFYTLIQDEDTLAKISVNLLRSESIMERLSFNELEEYFNEVEHVQVSRLEDTVPSIHFESNAAFGLLKIALILIMFFVLSETLIHRYLK